MDHGMTNDRFRGSRLKIDRARKHLSDFYEMFVRFSNSNFKKLGIEEHPEKAKTHSLRIDMDMAALNTLADDATMIIGDVLHNLKSSLDHLYFQSILACGGTPTDHTRFPIRETREELNGWRSEVLNKKQLSETVANTILNNVKPYQTGNAEIFGLHKLNIIDKHEQVVPTLKLVGFFNVRLENEDGEKVGMSEYIAEVPCLIPLTGTHGMKIKLKNDGRASANIIFDSGASVFRGETVFPTLDRVAAEVTRTGEQFEALLP